MSNSLPYRLFKLNPEAVRKAKKPYPLSGPALGSLLGPNEVAKLVSCNYVTVSHVWGNKPPSFNMTGIPWTVPVSSEDKLLSILQSCDNRGYEYVWMDILCINQTRDDIAKKEKDVEMGKMQQYYKDAHTTLVVGADWENFASIWKKLNGAIREWNGNTDQTIDPNWDGLGYIDQAVRDDWFHRVWTLQETVIPLTTSPHDTIIVKPPPYYPARLLTSDGTPMDVRGLCDLIDWTYAALGKLKHGVPSKYPWIHPGAGVVNDRGWWMPATLSSAIRLGATPLHPLEALSITRYRNTSYDIDRLKGVYALIDPTWQVTQDKIEDAWAATTKIYIDKKEGALLLAMAVTASAQGTWAAGGVSTDRFGSHIPASGKWKIISADIKPAKALHLKVAGVSKITFPTSKSPYGDGSGELYKLLADLTALDKTHDITSICALLKRAIIQSNVHFPDHSNLDSLPVIKDIVNANANAVSSGLRAVFNGWDRWVISVDQPQLARPKALLGWLPFEKKEQLGSYSLLWVCHGQNDWAVIGKAVTGGFSKVGIAFVNANAPEVVADVVIV